MSSATRTSTRAGQQTGPLVSFVIGIILLIIGSTIQTERFRAIAIITGVLLVLYGGLHLMGRLIESDIDPNNRKAIDDIKAAKRLLLVLFSFIIISIAVIIINFNELVSDIAVFVIIGSVLLSLGGYGVMKEAKENAYLDEIQNSSR